MNTWAGIWRSMLDSTIWEEPGDVRLTWIALLLLKDVDHVVRLPMRVLAKKVNLSENKEEAYRRVEAAMKVLESPDEKSLENQEFDGRRIRQVPDGWLLLNGATYDEKMRTLSARWRKTEKQRQRRQEGREKKRPAKNPLPGERAYEKAALAGDEKEMERVLESRLPVDPNIAAKALVAEAKGVMREIRAERRAENKEEKASEAEAFRQRTLAKMAEAAKSELPPEPEGLPADEQPTPGAIPEL